ncbi:MAG: DEAD/DEAH box helicase family protein [Thermoguttaceae bacterium]|nr:DEAD/DEAH box helicase family protein [Thermoguttaceae bacterium]
MAPELKFKYKILPYQEEAVASVVKVFEGQPYKKYSSHTIDLPVPNDLLALVAEKGGEDDLSVGFGNAEIALTSQQLFENLVKVQQENNISLSKNGLTREGAERCNLDIEMETGTGKTYVYINTIFELNAKYGWRKFIVVVPSIAIREGVKKGFETTAEHFHNRYQQKAKFFVYDSRNLTAIRDFSHNADINVMIVNIQAFNARGKDARRIRMELDEFGSRAPIEAIAANRPILILDEPQKMEGKATQEALKEFNPLFILNYSATHRKRHDLVYVLDAFDAYKQKLVKRIEVKGFDVRNLPGSGRYLYLSEIIVSKERPKARLEFEVKYSGGIKRDSRIVGFGDDIYSLSNGLEEYRELSVTNVDPIKAQIEFTDGTVVRTGEIVGDQSEKALRRAQIRETIRSHFKKEEQLYERGIKTLSLFFIDEVAKYRQYDDAGNEVNGEYGTIFEEEYNLVLNEYLNLFNGPYVQYLKRIPASSTHAGYFSIDKKTGRKTDSETKRGSDESDDVSAYDLILKDKERLLSFDEPTRFIFSHSALREGWDNPNVFQICALKPDGHSPTQKRQEVGRGLRLCVDQSGDRMDQNALGIDGVHNVNRLTVVAAGGYGSFVNDLQKGISEALYDRPKTADQNFFVGKVVSNNAGDATIKIDVKQAAKILFYLQANDYVDDDLQVVPKYREAVENGTLAPMPEPIADISDGVHKLVQSVYDPSVLAEMIENANETRVQENPINKDNFEKAEFKKLWAAISPKYAYFVEFDSEELIQNAVAELNKPENYRVSRLAYTVTTGAIIENVERENIEGKSAFKTDSTKTETLTLDAGSDVKYDLIGEIAKGATLTRKTVATILSKISPKAFDSFKLNPEEFIRKAIACLNNVKATIFVQSVRYDRLKGNYDSSIFTAERHNLVRASKKVEKCVQYFVFPDGYATNGDSVESKFVDELEASCEVVVYAKLPKGFAIPTPVGNYSPDWAIAFDKGKCRYVYFIAETKGSMDSMNLRPVEQAKIKCAKKLFEQISANLPDDEKIRYECVDSFEELRKVVQPGI